MADEPISALTQIGAPTGTPPYPTSFTNPSTGAMLEILDTTNTSMASTGTNSKIAPGDLIKGYLNAGSNVTLTETAGVVTIAASGGGGMTVGSAVSGGSNRATLVEDGSGNLAALAIGSTGNVLTVASGAPAWAAPLTANYLFSALSSDYTVTGTMANVGPSITLPVAGTYLLIGTALADFTHTGSVGQFIQISAQLYDSTNSAVVPNTYQTVSLNMLQAASTNISQQQAGPIGPVFYTVAGSTVINLQSKYLASSTAVGVAVRNTAYGNTMICAIRIA